MDAILARLRRGHVASSDARLPHGHVRCSGDNMEPLGVDATISSDEEPMVDVHVDANILNLLEQCKKLERRVQELENTAELEREKQNRIIMCELVKDARAKIFEANNLPLPNVKGGHSWSEALETLTRQQLMTADVPIKQWPQIKEILSPSNAKLNAWVHGYFRGKHEALINDMSPTNRELWQELFNIVNYTPPVDEPHDHGSRMRRRWQERRREKKTSTTTTTPTPRWERPPPRW